MERLHLEFSSNNFGHLCGIGDGAGDRGNVSFGVVQGLALEEGVVVVVSPNLPHQEQGLAEVVLATYVFFFFFQLLIQEKELNTAVVYIGPKSKNLTG